MEGKHGLFCPCLPPIIPSTVLQDRSENVNMPGKPLVPSLASVSLSLKEGGVGWITCCQEKHSRHRVLP